MHELIEIDGRYYHPYELEIKIKETDEIISTTKLENKKEEINENNMKVIYNQLSVEIREYINDFWQSSFVLLIIFMLYALFKNALLSLDILTSISLLLCAWLFTSIFYFANKYNKEIHLLYNIEQEFIKNSNIENINKYLKKDKLKNKMNTQLKLQFILAIGMTMCIIGYHFWNRIIYQPYLSWNDLSCIKIAPYAILGLCIGFLLYLKTKYNKKYYEFVEKYKNFV